jgi:hypothetical protein
MKEEDRQYMIADKDSGIIIDSRNEEVVENLFNNKKSQININLNTHKN